MVAQIAVERPFSKALPTLGDVHVSRPLNDMSIGWMQNQTQFVADKVFPVVPVQKQADFYYEYDRADWYRSEAKLRAPATPSEGGGWRLSTSPYTALRYSLHKDIADEILRNADAAIPLDRDATEWITQQLMLKRETIWMDKFFTGGIWTNESTPGTLWDAGGSTPIQDIRAQIFAIHGATGYKPNTLVLGPNVHKALVDHPDIIARVNAGQTPVGPAVSNDAVLARILELERVMTAWAVRNDAAEGATENTSFIADNDALLVYSAPRPGLFQPSAGFTFAWTGFLGSSALGGRMKKFRIEEIESNRIEGDLYFDMKIIAQELGHFFLAAVA